MRTCFFIFLIGIVMSGCTNDSTADLAGLNTNIVTYSASIKNIIDNNCTSCHASTPINGAPMPLTNYEHVKNAVINRGLIDRISRPEATPGLMPNGGPRLPQHIIDQVTQWQSQGMPQ